MSQAPDRPTPSRFWVAAIALAATVPFLDKAYHIDDVLYLSVANQILRDPLDPYGGPVLWDAPDGQPAPIFQIDHNPPLWKYLLAATIRLLGADEWKLHLLESSFVWLAAGGLWRLGRRLNALPVWSAGMILLGPAFLPGQNVMSEGPLLCLWVWTLELEFRAWESGRARWAWLAGLVLAAAVLIKYTAALVFVLIAFGCYRYRRLVGLWALVPAGIALAAWETFAWWRYGLLHSGSHGLLYGISDWPVRALTVVRCLGAVTVLGPAVGWLLIRQGKAGRIGLAACLAAGLALAGIDVRQACLFAHREGMAPTTLQQLHFVAFTFHGAFSLLGLAGWALIRRRRSNSQLADRSPPPASASGTERWEDPASDLIWMWLVCAFLFNVTSVPFQAVRHVLWVVVPMTWLVALGLAGTSGRSMEGSRSRLVIAGPGRWLIGRLRPLLLTASTGLGLVLAAADYEIAGLYRRLGDIVFQRYVSLAPTWFTGDWGVLYYGSRAGAHPLVREPERYTNLPPMQSGSFLIRPMVVSWKPIRMPPGFETGPRPLAHLQPEAINPFRTLAPGVNYHSVRRDFLPWEILVVWQVGDAAGFQLPPLDDILVYELFASRPPSER